MFIWHFYSSPLYQTKQDSKESSPRLLLNEGLKTCSEYFELLQFPYMILKHV